MDHWIGVTQLHGDATTVGEAAVAAHHESVAMHWDMWVQPDPAHSFWKD